MFKHGVCIILINSLILWLRGLISNHSTCHVELSVQVHPEDSTKESFFGMGSEDFGFSAVNPDKWKMFEVVNILFQYSTTLWSIYHSRCGFIDSCRLLGTRVPSCSFV